jgi:hypothetical protein
MTDVLILVLKKSKSILPFWAIRDDIASPDLIGEMKSLPKKPHQQGYAPVAGYTRKNHD